MSLLSRLAVTAARAYGALSSNPNAVSASYLVVAGGGSGGSFGGGGAGGLLASTTTLSTLTTYTVTVGAGGSGASVTGRGNSGSNSVLSGTGLTTITSTGGGAGAGEIVTPLTGGSGGGGGGDVSARSGAVGTSGQGSAGGNGNDNGAGTAAAGGGGGGAGVVGSTASASSTAGNGGAGTASSISGSSVTYAGGGGGGAYLYGSSGTAGTGGSSIGGNGGRNGLDATAGTTNTGSGGGGRGLNSAGNYQGSGSGSGGSGIVIISYASATPRFVGGTLTTSGGNQIHTFTSSGTLSPLTPITASYLVVAGGGGGSTYGGGGAGGLLTSSTTIYSGATYVVTVGAGGAGDDYASLGVNGNNSVLSGTGLTTLTAIGGGGGASSLNASSGGSGGGGGSGNGAGTGGAGTSGQGFAGGNAASGTAGGGGGGAGAVGGTGVATTAGNGGVGVSSSISGSSVFYAGGGGGGTYNGVGIAGTGGNGGGGNGSITVNGDNGTSNLGGGGGGGRGGAGDFDGGAGGSGVVIISYAGSQVFNGGLVTSSGGNTIHTFNATGALTPLTNNLNNSLRFRASNSAYLSRTPTIAGSRTTWTWSAWVKKAINGTGNQKELFGVYSSSTNFSHIYFDTTDTLIFTDYISSSLVSARITNAVYRDPSAWYHIVVVYDTTQATANDRIRMYINGNQITSFSTTTNPSQNYASGFINSAAATTIGVQNSAYYFDGYMTDINFIDGQALEPYYFGNNDAYGNWKPILYKGTYGTNGFYLTFADASAATAAAIGKDSSGNGNNWTPSGINLNTPINTNTSYDAMLDVPTNTSATVANYCTLNPLTNLASLTVSNANLSVSASNGNWKSVLGTMALPSTGKWYWEVTVVGSAVGQEIIGVANTVDNISASYSGSTANTYGYQNSGNKNNNATGAAYGASYTTNDIIGVAVDTTAGTIVFYKNNTSQGTAFTGLSSSYSYIPVGSMENAASNLAFNFGQRPFTYTAPSGYVALNTYNLPTPTILQGNKYMDATTYTGTGSAQTIVNAALFKPDLVWGKARSTTRFNVLVDSVRGSSKDLYSNSTSAEYTDANVISSINSNGFSLGTDAELNLSANTFVAWQWQAGQGSTTTGTGTGGITSVTQSVNATAGFSIVTYTGSGSNGTVTHGLGVAPKWVIVKARSVAGENWQVYSSSLTSAAYRIRLNATDAQDSQPTMWNSTAPTSTVFSVGTASGVNTSAVTYVAYCWAEIAGFSKFGSYTGNGSTDGPFVYLGFRPKFVMWKMSNGGISNWLICDSSRNQNNVVNLQLFPDTNDAEITSTNVDFLSNGFKCRSLTTASNGLNGGTYIYMAFAENPFNNSNAR